MNGRIRILALLTISYTYTCCSSGIYQDVTAHFYCVSGKYNRELQLYINGEFQSRIPFSDKKYDCDSDSLNSHTYSYHFKQGTYEIKALTFSGELVSWGILKFTNGDMELIGKAGAMDSRQNSDCLTVEIQ